MFRFILLAWLCSEVISSGRQQTKGGTSRPTPQQFPPSTSKQTTSSGGGTAQSGMKYVSRRDYYNQNKGKCTVLINEVMPTYVNEEDAILRHFQFVELVRKCGPRAPKPVQNKLDGFMLFFVEFGTYMLASVNKYVPTITFSVDLTNGIFVEEKGEDGALPTYYYTVGNNLAGNASFDRTFAHSSVRTTRKTVPMYTRAIPPERESPTVIVLVKYEGFVQKEELLSLIPQISTGQSYNPVIADTAKIDVLKKYMKDMFVYGNQLSPEHSEGISYMLGKYLNPNTVPQFSSKSTKVNHEKPTSFSRCAEDNFPFQIDTFRNAEATPGKSNRCDVAVTLDYPYVFHKPIQSTGRKMLLNCVYTLRQTRTDPSLLEGNLVTVASRLLGVSKSTTYRVKTEALTGIILTPGKTRQRTCRKIQIDTFDRDTIRTIITKCYANNTVPFAARIRQEFLEAKTHEWETQKRRHEQDPVRFSDPGAPFTCSEKSFRKIMRLMNYKYGRIDTRAVILQRPDIVNLRARFLHALRKNAALPIPKKLVYIDETWVDGNMRLAKGWVPRTCDKFKEMSAFTFSNAKVGKGDRIVVLAAITEDGVVQESILVFTVKKTASTEDYHDNIDRVKFKRWVDTLLTALDKTKKPHVIVMDNAPYHTVKLVPSKSKTKQVLWDYINEHKNYPGAGTINLRPVKDMRKYELEELIDTLSKLPSIKEEMYEIDKHVKSKGHSVLRLPPYNCDMNPIEFVWSDIKFSVRKQNANVNLTMLKHLAETALKTYSADKVKAHWIHAKKIQDKYWDEDGFIEQANIPQIQINIAVEDSDEEDEDTSEDDDSELEIEDDDEENEDEDEVEYGGNIVITECLETGQQFALEREIAQYMTAPNQRARGRARGRGGCTRSSRGRRLFP